MTPSELLALVGRSWSRLLLYPGGLSMLAFAWLAFDLAPSLFKKRARWQTVIAATWRALATIWNTPPLLIAAPWLATALLPLPGAADLGRSLDALVALVLLDMPWWYGIANNLRHPEASNRKHGARTLAAWLNGYPPLLLALLVTAGNSLDLVLLTRAPAGGFAAVAHWFGAVACSLALPPVLALGAFASGNDEPLPFVLRLRAVGYVGLATLPWLGLFEGRFWFLAPPLIVALLWGFHQATRGQKARRWAQAYLVLGAALLVMLLATAGLALSERLR